MLVAQNPVCMLGWDRLLIIANRHAGDAESGLFLPQNGSLALA
jgi:hypothetical protein